MKRATIIAVCICLMFCAFNLVLYGQTSNRKIKIKKDQLYLNFPVTESDTLKKARILVDGKVIDEFTISLSEGEPR
jgi:fructan beta-fructosidase